MFCTAPEAELSLSQQRAEQMDRASSDLPTAASLNRFLSDAEPVEIVRAARDLIGRERLAVVSSFGIEFAALLKLVGRGRSAIPVCCSIPDGCSPRRSAIAIRSSPSSV